MVRIASHDDAGRYAPDGPYAFAAWPFAAVATIAGAGMWAVVVVLPEVQADSGSTARRPPLPYMLTMFGFALARCLGTVGRSRAASPRRW